MFENLGGGEVLLIFLVILIFFGPKKIPELATSFGKGLRKFRDAKEGLEDQLKTVLKEPVEALQAAKSNFDMHMNAAAQQVQETSKSLEANLPAASPLPAPAQPPTETTPNP
ncbi:MAG: twin-arginine translocase TatA/TatE family subunit [Bacteroidota bacterium]|nr:twin-arginine translocase TatA/TatE family subunit [Bacteroidota bacterium]MDP4234842.1 twin-arginine translocase TatA/TatE family subunit [Bacteroidota bacterium]